MAIHPLVRAVAPALLGLLIVAGAVCAADDGQQAGPVAPRPVVSVVLSGQTVQGMHTFGQVAAKTVTDLGFAQSGKLSLRTVGAGAVIVAGTLLAALDPVDLDANLRAAEASLAASEAQLKQAASAESRARQLASTGSGSTTDLEAATLSRISAEAAVDQARAGLESSRDLRSGASLLAPTSGVVLQVFAEPGTNVQAGQTVVRLASLDRREVLIDLTEAELRHIPEGADFTIRLDVNPKITAIAKVAQIDPVAEKATRTRRLHLALINPPGQFRIGALTRVDLNMGAATKQMILQENSVLVENSAAFVWRVDRPSGVVSRVAVRALALGDGVVQVTEGLSDGDEIVVKGIHSLTEGQIVGPQVTP